MQLVGKANHVLRAQIVITSRSDAADTRVLLEIARRHPHPHQRVLPTAPQKLIAAHGRAASLIVVTHNTYTP